jgi:exopolysaccharide biosynthesis polyprenyl glycosylphosphotransferase
VAKRALSSTELMLPDQGDTEGDRASRTPTSHQYARLAVWIALTDVIAVEAAIALTRYIRMGLNPAGPNFATIMIVTPFVVIPIFAGFRLYSFSRLSPAEEFRRLFEASGVVVAVKLVLSLALEGGSIEDALSRGWLGLCWILAIVLLLIHREVWHKYMGRLRSQGRLAFRTVVVGTNDEAVRIGHTLRTAAHGYQVLGLLSTGPVASTVDGISVLGEVEDLPQLIPSRSIECVFVASTALDGPAMKRTTEILRHHPVEVRVSANMTEILSSRLTVQPVGDLLALSLRPTRLSGYQAVVKRSFDLIVASLAVMVAAPLWLAIAALIKTTSRGPVLYQSKRVGQDGRSFRMYKFRTMVRGADLLLPQLLDKNEFSGGVLFKLRNDPRVTKIGGWLRRWSLDELPQLLNVLKGDMSLVGPRPALPHEVEVYEEWHLRRLEVRPGLTGLWQVGGRSELSFDDYVRLDLFYIENWSVIYDLFILGKTLPAVLMRKGAY